MLTAPSVGTGVTIVPGVCILSPGKARSHSTGVRQSGTRRAEGPSCFKGGGQKWPRQPGRARPRVSSGWAVLRPPRADKTDQGLQPKSGMAGRQSEQPAAELAVLRGGAYSATGLYPVFSGPSCAGPAVVVETALGGAAQVQEADSLRQSGGTVLADHVRAGAKRNPGRRSGNELHGIYRPFRPPGASASARQHGTGLLGLVFRQQKRQRRNVWRRRVASPMNPRRAGPVNLPRTGQLSGE